MHVSRISQQLPHIYECDALMSDLTPCPELIHNHSHDLLRLSVSHSPTSQHTHTHITTHSHTRNEERRAEGKSQHPTSSEASPLLAVAPFTGISHFHGNDGSKQCQRNFNKPVNATNQTQTHTQTLEDGYYSFWTLTRCVCVFRLYSCLILDYLFF